MEEIAFAGRSNVGKSSLINALTGRKGLAKTSNTPGRTQQLNYFNLADKLFLVDLPGYGFAKAPENLVKQWQKMIFAYLQGRVNLKRVFLLIDSRHGIKKVDREIMEMLDKAAVTYQIILTKSDKISTGRPGQGFQGNTGGNRQTRGSLRRHHRHQFGKRFRHRRAAGGNLPAGRIETAFYFSKAGFSGLFLFDKTAKQLMMRPTNILLTNHYNFMQKEQIIRSVSEAVFFDSQEIRLDRESKNFGENVEKIARYLSANIILSAPGLTVYVGNPRLPRRLVKRFGGKTRHSVSLYWQGTVGIAPLLGFLSRETGVQTLRFNVEKTDLPAVVSRLQKLFRRSVVLEGNQTGENAYIGSCRQAWRLKRKYGKKTVVRKYANYWLWLAKDLPLKDNELTSFITPA